MANQEQPSTTAQNTPTHTHTLSLSLSLSNKTTKQNQNHNYLHRSLCRIVKRRRLHHPRLILSHRYHPLGHHTRSQPCSSTRSNQCHRHILCPRWRCVRCYFHRWSLDWRWSLGRQWSLDQQWDGGLGDGAWGGSMSWVGGIDRRWGSWPAS